jgi:predicted dehydrogenase
VSETKKGVAVIGAGLQARRRVAPIAEDPEWRVAVVVDRKEAKAKALADTLGARASTDWQSAIAAPDVDVVLVLTYPDSHAEISIAAMDAGKDVLCEKPLTRTLDEGRAMIAAQKKNERVLKCGFNHRHHPAVWEAHRKLAAGVIGKPMFGRARYGIGGRQGIENEWRSDPKIVSGGQMMEQGIHVVDLFRWMVGEPVRVTGMTSTTRFPIAPLEDNGFALLQTKEGAICSVHSSLTQWTNLFELEVYGDKGSLCVHGLGASYGVEKLVVALHDPSGPFSHETIEYRGGDVSWKDEWKELVRAVKDRSAPLGSGEDGLRAMEIVQAIYDAAKTGRAVDLS